MKIIIRIKILIIFLFISNVVIAQSEIPNMVFVKGGSFEMGSSTGYKSAKPVHPVTLSDFYISKYEVTNTEYCKFLNSPKENPQGPETGTEKAVRGGSWNDYVNFLENSTRLRASPNSKYGENIGGFGFRIAYSPGYVLAFSSYESGDSEIYLSDINGNSKKQITNKRKHDGYVNCSPNGKRIAFYSYLDLKTPLSRIL